MTTPAFVGRERRHLPANSLGRVLDFLTFGFLAKLWIRRAQHAGSEAHGPPDVYRAIMLFTRAIEVSSSRRIRTHALYLRAWGWRSERRLDEAMADYCAMIELVPEDAGAHFQRALTYLSLHHWFDDPESGNWDADLVRATGAGRGMAIRDLQFAAESLEDADIQVFVRNAMDRLTGMSLIGSGGIEEARQSSAEIMKMEAREYNLRLARELF